MESPKGPPPPLLTIPLINAKRLELLQVYLPYLSPFVYEDRLAEMQKMTFISSRALCHIVTLVNQFHEMGKTIRDMEVYLGDTIDDEVKHVALSASQKTATEILKKMGYTCETSPPVTIKNREQDAKPSQAKDKSRCFISSESEEGEDLGESDECETDEGEEVHDEEYAESEEESTTEGEDETEGTNPN